MGVYDHLIKQDQLTIQKEKIVEAVRAAILAVDAGKTPNLNALRALLEELDRIEKASESEAAERR